MSSALKITLSSLLAALVISGCGRSGLSSVNNPVINDRDIQAIDQGFAVVAEEHENSIKLILNSPATKSTKLSSQEIIANLKKSASGLLMPSESDYPFKPFLWSGQANTALVKEKLLKLTNHSQNTPVQLTTLDNLFRNVTEYYDGQTPQEKEEVIKFRNLSAALKKSFSDIQVFRVGSVEIDVYITGKNNQDYLGLSTKLIETRR